MSLSSVWRVVALLLTAMMGMACGRRGVLAEAAEKARREGRTTASVGSSLKVDPIDGDLAVLGTEYTIVLARVVKHAAAQSVTPDMIFTWSVFQADVLSKGKGESPAICQWAKPPQLVLRPDEIAIPRRGGATVIKGVRVTDCCGGWLPTDPAERYVMFTEACAGQVMVLPDLGQSMFEVTKTNELLTSPWYWLSRQLADVRTLDNLQRMLKTQ